MANPRRRRKSAFRTSGYGKKPRLPPRVRTNKLFKRINRNPHQGGCFGNSGTALRRRKNRRGKRRSLQFEHSKWLPRMDSNHENKIQNLVCCQLHHEANQLSIYLYVADIKHTLCCAEAAVRPPRGKINYRLFYQALRQICNA